ncbi:hypothetical protein LEP1GSC074_1729 [Leptospira noguchii str. Hook]|nr:hypothetical protein LEP1GSC041_2814 [Leptospira noguchii str. 2006001870]EMS83301.1 hypothetical protein LEP1GSC074_1729 [Leptospira noguchii str. Hook]
MGTTTNHDFTNNFNVGIHIFRKSFFIFLLRTHVNKTQ